MKFLLVNLFLLLSYIVQAQNETYLRKNYTNNKVCVVKLVQSEDGQESKYDTIIPLIYDEIIRYKEHFILIDSIVEDKKKNYYKGVTLIDFSMTQVKYFEIVSDINDQFILELKNKEKYLYSIEKKQYLGEKGDAIDFYLKNNKNFNCVVFHSSKGVQVYDDKSTLLINHEKDAKVVVDYEAFKIQVGHKNYSLYSFGGKFLEDNIKDYKKLNHQYTLCELSSGNQTLLKSNFVQFDNYNVQFNESITNENRIIYKKDKQFFVMDSLGKVINKNPFQDIGSISPKTSNYPNWVKQNDQFFFIDNDLISISDEKYYYLEELRADVIGYKVMKTKSDIGYFAYNTYGKVYLNTMVDDIFTVGDYGSAIVLQNSGKYAVSFGHDQLTEFNYSTRPKALAEDFTDLIKAKNNSNEMVAFNYAVHYEGDHYTGLGLTDIIFAEDDFFIDYEVLMLYKGDKFCFSNEVSHKQHLKDSNEITFTYNDYQIDEEWSYDTELIMAEENGKWGLVNANTGVPASDFKYDKIVFDLEILDMTYDTHITIYLGKKMGFLVFDKKTRKYIERFEPIYDKIGIDDEYFVFKLNGKYEVMNINYDTIPTNFVFTEEPTSNFFYNSGFENSIKGKVNGIKCKCYLLELPNGKTSTSCYQDLVAMKGMEEYYLYTESSKIGLLNYYADTLLTANFDHISLHPNEDYLLTSIDGKKGVRDMRGNIIIPEKFDKLEPDYEYYTEIVLVEQESKWGLYQGKIEKLKPEYDQIVLSEEYIYVFNNNKWGAYNHYFKLVKELKCDSLKELQEELLNG